MACTISSHDTWSTCCMLTGHQHGCRWTATSDSWHCVCAEGWHNWHVTGSCLQHTQSTCDRCQTAVHYEVIFGSCHHQEYSGF